MAACATKPTVYVVDDDSDVLISLHFLLETDGFEVRTFRSGAALLTGMGSSDIDCFVIDYKMPKMNGIDLAGQLRQRQITAPIILITGCPDANIAARATAAGVRCSSRFWLKTSLPEFEGPLATSGTLRR